MKKIQGFLKKYWITVWLVIALVACSSFFAYAAFTRINIVKRVVSTDAGVGARFSSDSLDSTSSGMMTRRSFPSRDSDANVEVNIFNYPYPKASLYRNVATEYSLVARIGTHDGTAFTPLSGTALTNLSNNYYIKYKNGTNQLFNANSGTVSFPNCTIAAGKVNPDLFNVHFDVVELGDTPPGYCVEMIATPKDTSLPVLTGYISVRYTRQTESGWSGTLEELSNTKIYDGYNYILEGSGAGKLTFHWDPTYVTINKQFLRNTENTYYINDTKWEDNLTLTEDDIPTVSGMKSLTLVVDSQKKNRYEVQFYKTDSNNELYDYNNTAIKNYLPDTTSSDWIENTGN